MNAKLALSGAICLVAVGLASIPLLVARYRTGDFRRAIRYLQGTRVFFVRDTVDVGTCTSGTIVKVPLVLHNCSSTPVMLWGLQASCNCISADTAEASIDPDDFREISVDLYTGRGMGNNEQAVQVFVGNHELREIRCQIRWQIEDHQSTTSENDSGVEPPTS